MSVQSRADGQADRERDSERDSFNQSVRQFLPFHPGWIIEISGQTDRHRSQDGRRFPDRSQDGRRFSGQRSEFRQAGRQDE